MNEVRRMRKSVSFIEEMTRTEKQLPLDTKTITIESDFEF